MIRRIAEAVRIAFGPHDRCAVGGDAVGDRLVGPVGHEDLEGLVDCSGHDRGGEGGVAAAGDGEPFGLRFRQREAEGDTEEVASFVGAAHIAGLVLHPQLRTVESDRFGKRRLGPERCRGEALAVDRRHCSIESLDRVEHR